jgi:putative SOS response-associated peptidase YedK
MAEIHNRMPVIMDPENESKWLDISIPVEDALQLLHPFDNSLKIYPVSTAVNSPKNNGKELIEAWDVSKSEKVKANVQACLF